MQTVDINFRGINLSVEGIFDKGEDTIWYDSDMGGYPGSGSSFDVVHIFAGEEDIYELISSQDQEIIENLIVSKLEG